MLLLYLGWLGGHCPIATRHTRAAVAENDRTLHLRNTLHVVVGVVHEVMKYGNEQLGSICLGCCGMHKHNHTGY